MSWDVILIKTKHNDECMKDVSDTAIIPFPRIASMTLLKERFPSAEVIK